MSRRRKHVRNLVDEALPELTEGDEVCRVTELRGGNQVEVRISRASPARTAAAARPGLPISHRLTHTSQTPTRNAQVEKADGASTLIRIPAKFSKVLWVRKGTHVLAHIEPNLPDDVKVTGELLRVLYKAQIREMRKDGTWPRAFDDLNDDAMDDDVADGGGAHGVDVQRGALEGLSIGADGCGGDDSCDDDDLPPLAANRNRRPLRREVESSSESEDGEEENGDDSDSSDEE